jgi:hypothetical protein
LDLFPGTWAPSIGSSTSTVWYRRAPYYGVNQAGGADLNDLQQIIVSLAATALPG